MENDLLSNFDINDIDKKLSSKNVRLIIILLILSVIYSMDDLVYIFIKLSLEDKKGFYKHFFYAFRILSFVSIGEVALITLSHIFYYKALKSQSTALDTRDSILLNKSAGFFNKSLIMWIIYLSIILIRVVINHVLYPQSYL